jgi:hypothetical protein
MRRFTLPSDPDTSVPPQRHYVQFDWDLPDEELEPQIMEWLTSILGPPSDDPDLTDTDVAPDVESTSSLYLMRPSSPVPPDGLTDEQIDETAETMAEVFGSSTRGGRTMTDEDSTYRRIPTRMALCPTWPT